MFNYWLNALVAAAASVETPIGGQTGVWIKSGTTVIGSGMKMIGATVISGQTQTLYLRGEAQTNTIVNGGRQYVYSGGNAKSCEYFGILRVYSGGTVVSPIFSSGANVAVSAGGVLTGGTHKPGASFNVYGVASLIAVDGTMFVSSGGLLESATVAGGGEVDVRVSGTVSGAIVESAGRLIISSGALGYSPVISSGGSLNVHAGASAVAVVSSAGAVVGGPGDITYA